MLIFRNLGAQISHRLISKIMEHFFSRRFYLGNTGGQYRIRTSDIFGVNAVSPHTLEEIVRFYPPTTPTETN